MKHFAACLFLSGTIVSLLMTACTATPAMPVVPPASATITLTTSSSPIAPATSTAARGSAATLIPPAAFVPTLTPTSLPPLMNDDSWATYTNDEYGFSFHYPAGWNLKEITGSVNTMSGHAVHLLHPTDPAVRMIIAFKRADEDQQITPTGMGGGELVSHSSVSLLGQPMERILRVELGKDMAVYYGWPRAAVASDDLVFWLALDCACSPADPAVTGLTPEVERIADTVVESIEVRKCSRYERQTRSHRI